MKADRLSFVTPALGVDEAAKVTNGVDPPTRMSDVGLELLALIAPQGHPLSGAAFSKDDSEPRPIHRIDQETNKGGALPVGQVNPEKVPEVP